MRNMKELIVNSKTTNHLKLCFYLNSRSSELCHLVLECLPNISKTLRFKLYMHKIPESKCSKVLLSVPCPSNNVKHVA